MALQLKAFANSNGWNTNVDSGGVSSWSNTNLSGTHQTKFRYVDSDYGGNSLSTMNVTVTDNWTGSYDCKTNKITIKLSTTVNLVRTINKANGNNDDRTIRVFASPSASCYVNGGLIYSGVTSSLNKTLTIRSNQTIVLNPGQSTSNGSAYIINNSNASVRPNNLCSPSGKASDWTVVHSVCQFTGEAKNPCVDFLDCGVSFKNSYPTAPSTPSGNLSCAILSGNDGASKAKLTLSGVNYNCPSGNSCTNKSTVYVSRSSNFSDTVYTSSTTGTSATFNVSSLNPNTKYYTKAIISNGYNCEGVANYVEKTCQFTTLATSTLSNPKYVNNTKSTVLLSVNNGAGECNVSTKIFYKLHSGSTWTEVETSGTTSIETINIRNVFQKGNTYDIKAETTNCSGTYTSNVVSLALPADGVSGVITSSYTEIEDGDSTATGRVCYTIEGNPTPVQYRLEYRPVGADTWEVMPYKTSNTETTSDCETITEMATDTCYEFRTYQKAGDAESYSAVFSSEKTCTPSLLPSECYICENLEYMTELICQQAKRIESGVKSIYANDETMEMCDPESQNPTVASMWSRILRFYHATSCVACDMSEISIGAGEDNQVWTGDIGWGAIDDEVTEDSNNLVESGSVKTNIEDFLHSVFHPIGTFDFYAESTADLELQAGAVNYDTAVVGDKMYTYQSGTWGDEQDLEHLDNMGIIVIYKGDYAGKELYYLDGIWSLLNADTKSLDTRVTALENNPPVVNYNDADKYNFIILPDSYTNAQIVDAVEFSSFPKNNDVIIYLTEDM